MPILGFECMVLNLSFNFSGGFEFFINHGMILILVPILMDYFRRKADLESDMD